MWTRKYIIDSSHLISLPSKVDTVLQRCLKREPTRRHADFLALIAMSNMSATLFEAFKLHRGEMSCAVHTWTGNVSFMQNLTQWAVRFDLFFSLSMRSSTFSMFSLLRDECGLVAGQCTRLADSLQQTVDASKCPTLVWIITQQPSCTIPLWQLEIFKSESHLSVKYTSFITLLQCLWRDSVTLISTLLIHADRVWYRRGISVAVFFKNSVVVLFLSVHANEVTVSALWLSTLFCLISSYKMSLMWINFSSSRRNDNVDKTLVRKPSISLFVYWSILWILRMDWNASYSYDWATRRQWGYG